MRPASANFPAGQLAIDLDDADVNRGGLRDMDIAVANFNANSVSVLWNRCIR
jgi:hypothetical protein